MATRNGKIANLPNDIREELNLRLLEGETGRELITWLNALPAVQSILGSQFNGSPISEVNLTHWRQGGYLQWLTERECFDSARALADGDSVFAEAGLSAERLLNILTLRLGQLLMRWDLPSEGVPDHAAFNQMARKARILQGISRSVLAIHRIQSQPARKTSAPSTSAAASPVGSEGLDAFAPALNPSSDDRETLLADLIHQMTGAAASSEAKPSSPPTTSKSAPVPAASRAQSAIPRVLSGPITPSILASKLPRSPFNADPALSAFLEAV